MKTCLLHARLREVRADLQKTNEEISTVQGNWEAATVKLHGNWIQRWQMSELRYKQ